MMDRASRQSEGVEKTGVRWGFSRRRMELVNFSAAVLQVYRQYTGSIQGSVQSSGGESGQWKGERRTEY